jgi:ABC-type spermidine/putrescine transport system permease subunit I
LIYEEFTAGRNWPMGSALSNVLLLVMLGIIVLYIKAVGTEDF